jgi:GNAT superfamily N-acetyltransferase
MQSTMMPVLPHETIEDLYPRYAGAWEVLLVEAAARHVLSLEEFREEMRDDRLEKHVVIDDDDRVVAMTTLTTELDAIPWINPTFYRHRFPAEAAAGTLFYLGYTFVDVDHRRSEALTLMAGAVNKRLAQAHGVIGFDICGWGMERGIGRRIERMFSGSVGVLTSDTQTYFVADYRHSPAEGPFAVSSLAERPDLVEDVRALLAEQWPAYTLTEGGEHHVDLEGLLLSIPDHQLLLIDHQDALCGVGLSLPLAWDGRIETLPSGWDDAIVSGQRFLASGGKPDTLCALSITVSAHRTGRGLAEQLLDAFKERGTRSGAHSMIAPLRPTQKSRYPLISMEEYLSWTRPDGQYFDPWLRLHVRRGAEVIGVADASMVVTGTVAEWEGWLGTSLPGSGDYVIEGALSPLHVDRAADLARYVEPNIWLRYPLSR